MPMQVIDSPIYFDHAATSWPKPAPVREAIGCYLDMAVGNPGRSGHRMSIAAVQLVERARERVSELFNIAEPARVAFTKNATEALNLGICGLLKPGDHVITSSIEHNAVMRPLRYLEANGVAVTVVDCAADGTLKPEDIRQALQPNTRLIVTLHGSNVMGTLLPIKQIAEIAWHNNLYYLVDASQTAGSVPIDIDDLGVDMLAFTGHKGLLGLTGVGGLYVREGVSLSPLIRGGTGSASEYETQPDFMPDCYESGTLNVAGLAALTGGVSYLLEVGIENIWQHEQKLRQQFLQGASAIPGLTLYGPVYGSSAEAEPCCSTISFNIANLPSSEVGLLLDKRYSVMSRVGLHCAPGAHRTLGTFPTGTVRFSFGYSNTESEIERVLIVLAEIAAWAAQR